MQKLSLNLFTSYLSEKMAFLYDSFYLIGDKQ